MDHILWRTRALPLYHVRFLDEASERLLLRKVGEGYQFAHRLLQDHLAGLERQIPPPPRQQTRQITQMIRL